MSKKSPQRTDPLILAMPLGGVDSHCHLDGEEFDNDREAVLARAHAAGLTHLGNVFLGPDDFAARHHLFADHPEVFFIMGIHPCDGHKCTPERLAAIRAAFTSEPRLRAVGEIGLDFHWNDCPHEIQYQALHEQLNLARELARPVVIHCREAEEDTLMILESSGFVGQPVLWHCFGLGPHMARRIIHNGWHISVPGPVTYKANAQIREAVACIPPDHLLLETDAPYLAPLPWRGKRNEPAFTVFTAQAIAAARGEDAVTLWLRCGENARHFFGLNAA